MRPCGWGSSCAVTTRSAGRSRTGARSSGQRHTCRLMSSLNLQHLGVAYADFTPLSLPTPGSYDDIKTSKTSFSITRQHSENYNNTTKDALTGLV